MLLTTLRHHFLGRAQIVGAIVGKSDPVTCQIEKSASLSEWCLQCQFNALVGACQKVFLRHLPPPVRFDLLSIYHIAGHECGGKQAIQRESARPGLVLRLVGIWVWIAAEAKPQSRLGSAATGDGAGLRIPFGVAVTVERNSALYRAYSAGKM